MERENLKQVTGYPEKRELITINFNSGKNYTGYIYYISELNKNGKFLVHFSDNKDNNKILAFEGSEIESAIVSKNQVKIKEEQNGASS